MGTVTVRARDAQGNVTTRTKSYAVESPSLQQETPVWSHKVFENYGLCQHTNFQEDVYKHQNALIDRLSDTGVHKFRSMYAHNLPKNTEAILRARLRGMKWHATIMTMASTRAEITARLTHLANNASDLVTHLEGINEPNEGTWVAACAQRQYWMHVGVRKNATLRALWLSGALKVGSPSMHDVRLDNSGGQDWIDFGEYQVTCDMDDPDYPPISGVARKVKAKEFCDFVNAHGYQGGGAVDRNRQRRVDYARAEFGNKPIIFSETGYTNTTGLPKSARTAQHKPCGEAQSAIYDCQIVFDFFNAGLGAIRYEALDDPDAAKLIVEANFGLWEVSSVDGDPDTTWTPKPVIAKIKPILTWLKDAGPAYVPQPIGLEVSKPSDVRTTLVQKRDGSTRLYAFRYGTIWDVDTEVPINLGDVNITVKDAQGERTIPVGPDVKAIDIRR